jgi:hypothetical protein
MPRTVIVVPTIRESCIRSFLEQWEREFERAEILLVEDNPTKTFRLGELENVTHYSWEDIDNELGASSWIIPRRTDCVRSFGYYMAWKRNPDMIVTLDDDCYPLTPGGEGFLAKHWERLTASGDEEAWNETGKGVKTRGIPYYETRRKWPVALNHGLWTRVPDYDAPTQMLEARQPHAFTFDNQTIPVGKYFPMCGMNVAFRPEIVPAFYFLLMGKNHEFDRFGDIWAGIFVKKICDHLGRAVHSGDPAVDHQRASNVFANLKKEAPGLELNEHLWRAVDSILLTGTTFRDCYLELSRGLARQENGPAYLKKLSLAMGAWGELFAAETPAALPSYGMEAACEANVCSAALIAGGRL